jgi:hypothetical protein
MNSPSMERLWCVVILLRGRRIWQAPLPLSRPGGETKLAACWLAFSSAGAISYPAVHSFATFERAPDKPIG